jgi:hypothetical protein
LFLGGHLVHRVEQWYGYGFGFWHITTHCVPVLWCCGYSWVYCNKVILIFFLHFKLCFVSLFSLVFSLCHIMTEPNMAVRAACTSSLLPPAPAPAAAAGAAVAVAVGMVGVGAAAAAAAAPAEAAVAGQQGAYPLLAFSLSFLVIFSYIYIHMQMYIQCFNEKKPQVSFDTA